MPISSAQAFGTVLRRRRREVGMTQEQLAEAAELHVNHVSFLERGMRTPSLDVVLQLAHGLGVQGSELVAYVEDHISNASAL